MRLFRALYVRRLFSLFTGIVFLNMSFFLAEVSALKIGKDKQLWENICKLIAGSAAEEEKDAFSGAADEDSLTQEIDLIFFYHTHAADGNSPLVKKNLSILTLGIPLFGNYEIYSPPPEV
jgi:hypothetical protein